MTWSAIAWTCATLVAKSEPAVYPIPPVPLRVLVEEAEVIATVNVRATEMAVPPYEVGYEIVELVVHQVLKGDPGQTTIRHVNDLRLLCPEPACFEPGTSALAFLDRESEGPTDHAPDGFFSHSLSYGSKTLADTDLALYAERVKEQLAILAMPKGPERLAAQVEWLVRCAEEPATRWEGAYEFAPSGNARLGREEVRTTPFAAALTAVQRGRLKEVLLLAPRFQSGERCLEHLLRDDRDPKLLAWLVARLRATLEAPPDGEVTDSPAEIAERIAARDDRTTVDELAEAIKSAERENLLTRDRDDEQRLLVERLLARRRLVAELLALFPPP